MAGTYEALDKPKPLSLLSSSLVIVAHRLQAWKWGMNPGTRKLHVWLNSWVPMEADGQQRLWDAHVEGMVIGQDFRTSKEGSNCYCAHLCLWFWARSNALRFHQFVGYYYLNWFAVFPDIVIRISNIQLIFFFFLVDAPVSQTILSLQCLDNSLLWSDWERWRFVYYIY